VNTPQIIIACSPHIAVKAEMQKAQGYLDSMDGVERLMDACMGIIPGMARDFYSECGYT